MDQSARNEFAILHLDASDEKSKFSVEVISFEIEEALSTAFKVQVYFLSASPTLPFEDIVGRGGALSLHTGSVGDRCWAGVVTEFELVHSEEHTGGTIVDAALADAGIAGPNYKGRSRYRVTVQPDMFRMSLRKNSRIFQDKSAIDIVKDVLKDWDMEVDASSKVNNEEHPKWDFKVQYQESDFDFVSRVLEDAGITYCIRPSPKALTTEKQKGNEVTKIILLDAPTTEAAIYDADKKPLPYLGDGPDKHHDMDPHIWMLSAKQWPRPLKKTIRDRDFHFTCDYPLENQPVGKPLEGRPAIESKYEDYEYQPGAYWFAESGSGGSSAQKYSAGTNKAQMEALPTRRWQAELSARTQITFKSNALDLEPSSVFMIGLDLEKHSDQKGIYDFNHPHPAFAPQKKLMVISRKITGQATGSAYESDCVAVYADELYRPTLKTKKPRIHGVQSAVVVGPAGSEIHVDEFGRCRVQFPWDRYSKFDADSSCWIRVSHAWAGGGFGFVAHPRVGHEVLVGFYEGDPDMPVVVGRVYNATTSPPYAPSDSSSTKSGLKTNVSPGGGGFNEMSFEDKAGSEEIHIQAQKNFTIVVNDSESHDIGTALSYKVGKSESHDVGESVAVKIGSPMPSMQSPGQMTGTESHEMFGSFTIKVGIPGKCCSLTITPDSIVLAQDGGDGKKSSITLGAGAISSEAQATMCLHSGKKFHMSSKEDIDVDAISMTIDTDKQLLLNCDHYDTPEVKAASAQNAQPASGPQHGQPGTPPYIPAYQDHDPVLPGPLEQVNVADGDDVDPANLAKDAAKAGGLDNVIGDAEKIGDLAGQAKDAVDAAKAGNIGDFVKKLGLPADVTDIPVMGQMIKAAYGVDMGLDQLATDVSKIVKPVEDQMQNWANAMTAFVPKEVKDLLGSTMGKKFLDSGVDMMLKDMGLPGGSISDMANKGIESLAGKVGKSPIVKAIMGGAVKDLEAKSKTALGDFGFKNMVETAFGGKSGGDGK